MAELLNRRHEAFARAIVAGRSQIDAWADAGGQRHGASAHKAAQRQDVRDRIAELIAQRTEDDQKAREVAVEAAGLSKEWIISRLKYTIERALRGKQVFKGNGEPMLRADGTPVFDGKMDGGTVVQGLRLAAAIGGHLAPDKVEHGGVGDFERMTTDQLEEQAKSLAGRLGLTLPPKTNGKAH